MTFAVVEGSATLSATETVTDQDGKAGVAITLGNEAGRVVVRASVPGAPAVEFVLFAGPHISAGGVVGGGLSVPRVTAVSPNAIISIFGANFAPEGTAKLISPDDLVDGRLPTRLGGVCVQIGPALARIFHVFPGQLNVQVPTICAGSARTGERTLRVSVDAALRAGIFKASGSFDPMGWSVGARRSFPRP